MDRDVDSLLETAAPVEVPPLDLADVRRRARRRRISRGGVMVAGVALLVPAVMFVMPSSNRTVELVDQPSPPASNAPSEAAAPPDWNAFSFHGLEVSVPPTWRFNAAYCGTPLRDTIMIDDGSPVATCGVPHRPGLTVARLTPADWETGRAWATFATTPTEVSGRPAFVGTGKAELAREARKVLVVPDMGVVLTVTLGDRDLADRIVASARVVTTDSNGCRSEMETLVASGEDVPERGLVPKGPAAAAVCRYTEGWLQRSARLDSATAGELAAALNALAPIDAGSKPACPDKASPRGFIVRFQYPDDRGVDVAAFLDDCRLKADNGARAGRMDFTVLNFLTDAVGYDAGFRDLRRDERD